MAKIKFWNGDRTVSTIAARDAINNKHEGLTVTVTDAIADETVGEGSAVYRWSNNRWLLLAKTTIDELRFASETKVISNGQVTADNIINDDVLLDVRIIDSNNPEQVIGYPKPIISEDVINLGTTEYDGHLLEYVYGYGTTASQVRHLVENLRAELSASAHFGETPPAGGERLWVNTAELNLYVLHNNQWIQV